ncbi:hypothetical protein SELMODRAFT_147945 [Selaginella moellendorffii]|uniref:Macrophage erythroblast attacher n=1 Tax=Selaginella moellendorffii TaxID=88036 RepID=D8RKS2_SELML|nr:protein MAEA homolog [Selaginella moellendorffii]EFJ27493.1 hypothetical protein SELMODRAFT_147945 [Selaginella moellendorffii]|eukprot:XP_002971744.1 protein MAEA homolog [Selaginella moellendorffii]
MNEEGAPAGPALDSAASTCHRCVETIKLEHQLVRVPYEVLKRSVRQGIRAVEKEVNGITGAVAEAGKKEVSRDAAIKQLDSCVNRLSGLKRKLREMHDAEEQNLQRSRARLDHLSDFCKDPKWKKTKLDRILVDYLLRSSYINTATKLVEHSSIQDLADLGLFAEAQQIIEGLKSKSCTYALNWCSENKGKLKKTLSVFEFKLRIQEFIELVRAEKAFDAVLYARKFLSQLAAVDMQHLQEAMTTLVLKQTTECVFYKTLFDDNQWEKLIQLFKDEFCKMHGMTSPSLLHIYIQAGLSALKTPLCYEETCLKDDPFSHEAIRKLAEPLPFMKHVRSRLICYITKELMDEDNPPMVLPNGYVYSTKALQTMSDQNNGLVTCPRTNEVFALATATRAFVS